MGWVDDLRGKAVGLDTAPFIYYIEQHTSYIDMLRLFFRTAKDGDIKVVTSVVTLVEALVLPLRNGDTKLAEQYREILFDTNNLFIIPLLREIAEEAAQLRTLYKFHTPDAIQIATAMNASASVFLTNDRQLQRASTIQVLVFDDLK